MELVLGTAQFGLDYGISNTDGKVGLPDIEEIIDCFYEKGGRTIDTACMYGDAEEILGNLCNEYSDLKFIGKTPHFDSPEVGDNDLDKLEKSFLESVNKLQLSHLHSLMVHRSSDLLKTGADKIYNSLLRFKEQGLISKIGLSAYNPDTLLTIINRYDIDIVQIPVNVFDQRMVKSGLVDLLSERDIETHVRSVFLQGLLLMDRGSMDSYFRSIHEYIIMYENKCDEFGISKILFAINFIKTLTSIDAVIVGVTKCSELVEVMSAIKQNLLHINCDKLSIADANFILPSNWAIADGNRNH